MGLSDHQNLIAAPLNQLRRMKNVRLHTVYDYSCSNLQKFLENAELVDWAYFTTSEADTNEGSYDEASFHV